jgi:hypothetical protein
VERDTCALLGQSVDQLFGVLNDAASVGRGRTDDGDVSRRSPHQSLRLVITR